MSPNPRPFQPLAVLARWSLAALLPLMPLVAQAVDTSCQLKFPIVLSHHWGARAICQDGTVTGSLSCVNLENYDRYCAAKGIDAKGQRTCGLWQVPDDEADLPPRDQNLVDPSLHRALRGYHRYFSKAIVDRLRQSCGNQVYLSDKPPYASNEVRARSLRHTVLQALQASGATKVIVVGMSQGSQDARFMTAALPVDDANPSLGAMKDKVAAVVTVVGEDAGAESAGLQLTLLELSNGGDWSDYAQAFAFASEDSITRTFWQRTVAGQSHLVLGEDCQGSDCHLATTEQRYRWVLRSLVDLSPRFMRPNWWQDTFKTPASWPSLKAYLGMVQDRWEDQVPTALETNNGVRYFSYAASIRNFTAGFDQAEAYYLMLATAGANDGYVSVKHQVLANKAANFEHIKTLNGSVLGRGYHHMFFSGRNDALYEPAVGQRELAPYGGTSADFYQQVACDLKARGF